MQHAPAVDLCVSTEHTHPRTQALHDGFDAHDITRLHHTREPYPLDPHEEDELVAILRLGQDQDRADLGDRLRQQRRREGLLLIGAHGQCGLVGRDVLDPDNPLVGLKLRHAIHQQERKPVGQDPLDGGVVEG